MKGRMLACAYLLTLLSVAPGCGEQGAELAVQSDPSRGYSVEFPDTWQAAKERMSRISDPRELFTLGTTTFHWKRTNCEAFAGAAGASMGPADVVVTVWERGVDRHSSWSDFPARPEAFVPAGDGEPGNRGCGEPEGSVNHWRNFSDANRHFHTLVRIGPAASSRAAQEAWRILNDLTLDPGYQPEWRASG